MAAWLVRRSAFVEWLWMLAMVTVMGRSMRHLLFGLRRLLVVWLAVGLTSFFAAAFLFFLLILAGVLSVMWSVILAVVLFVALATGVLSFAVRWTMGSVWARSTFLLLVVIIIAVLVRLGTSTKWSRWRGRRWTRRTGWLRVDRGYSTDKER